ncbi:DUF1800 domain-containing protein [Sphingomonas yantingensis]|uniref:Uncharacterized protein (DUF1800 family) n=1 Tax=Sphingomonas yantingensis TaxID=1241761 RepID=A0A7W9ANE0_9SPHN|nr:DUF1800 domain-containing protein [Sphingomonas yantingensis]MBB5697600.1 uncharacterized protein (DUF1800 family) [Sphingomonas yantingensis]
MAKQDIRIAWHRFGLGLRLNEAPPADARAWLERQITAYDPAPPPIAAAAKSPAIAAEIFALLEERQQARQEARLVGEARPMAANAIGPASRRHLTDAIGARGAAALSTDTPFAERLVHFWANHFAISADKQRMIALTGAFEFEAIRPHVMGRFADMVQAVERHPAMLIFLDQAQSVGPGSPAAQRAAANGRKRGLNENLAREIMELHTLGVRTGYSQGDVTELARALTGWTVGGLGQGRAGEPGRFLFARQVHEPGERRILGKPFAAGEEDQGAAMLDMLATHPATAKHIATKLARHFAGDAPPPVMVARLEAAFVRSGGDLPTVYRALIASPEVWVPQPLKFRSPWDWTIAVLRASGVREFPGPALSGLQQQLGQPVWKPDSPAGWDDTDATWAAPDALMRRVEAAQRLASRAQSATLDARLLARDQFPGSTSATAEAVARAESPPQALALLFASPDFMRR